MSERVRCPLWSALYLLLLIALFFRYSLNGEITVSLEWKNKLDEIEKLELAGWWKKLGEFELNRRGNIVELMKRLTNREVKNTIRNIKKQIIWSWVMNKNFRAFIAQKIEGNAIFIQENRTDKTTCKKSGKSANKWYCINGDLK